MLAITGTLLAGLAVLCVAIEATAAAALFGAVGFWMITQGA
jgi:hypothetical protein